VCCAHAPWLSVLLAGIIISEAVRIAGYAF